MARRVALARAIALDPDLIMYDEPFAGLDPISMGVAANLIRKLNDATGATSLVVSHDVPECFAICDHAYLLSSGGRVVAQGTPDELTGSDRPRGAAVHRAASPTDRCVSTTPRRRWRRTWGCRMTDAALGGHVLYWLRGLARDAPARACCRYPSRHSAFFFIDLLRSRRRRCAASAWW